MNLPFGLSGGTATAPARPELPEDPQGVTTGLLGSLRQEWVVRNTEAGQHAQRTTRLEAEQGAAERACYEVTGLTEDVDWVALAGLDFKAKRLKRTLTEGLQSRTASLLEDAEKARGAWLRACSEYSELLEFHRGQTTRRPHLPGRDEDMDEAAVAARLAALVGHPVRRREA